VYLLTLPNTSKHFRPEITSLQAFFFLEIFYELLYAVLDCTVGYLKHHKRSWELLLGEHNLLCTAINCCTSTVHWKGLSVALSGSCTAGATWVWKYSICRSNGWNSLWWTPQSTKIDVSNSNIWVLILNVSFYQHRSFLCVYKISAINTKFIDYIIGLYRIYYTPADMDYPFIIYIKIVWCHINRNWQICIHWYFNAYIERKKWNAVVTIVLKMSNQAGDTSDWDLYIIQKLLFASVAIL